MSSAEKRFFAKVNKTPEGCWLWTGCQDARGYGKLRWGTRITYAHRVSWELANGPIPKGLVIDHDNPEFGCGNPTCVNPDHLEAVMNIVNQHRKRGLNRNNKSGHRGVHWHKNRWAIDIVHNGVRYNGGRYKTLEEANEAAQQLRQRLHGEGGQQ